MSRGAGSPPSQVTREQETESRVANTQYLLDGWGEGRGLFPGFTLSGYCKRCPRKRKAGTVAGVLNSSLQTLGVSSYQTVKCLSSNSEKQLFSLKVVFLITACDLVILDSAGNAEPTSETPAPAASTPSSEAGIPGPRPTKSRRLSNTNLVSLFSSPGVCFLQFL